MELETQAKVLRILEEKVVRRVGEKDERQLDFWIISATNRNLEKAVSDHTFRKDLYFRLEEYPIYLPPLRERKEDIPLLANHFLQEFCDSGSLPQKVFSKDAIRKLIEYSWPGNIRELKNVVRRSAVRSGSEVINVVMLNKTDHERHMDKSPEIPPVTERTSNNMTDLDALEKAAIEKAYFITDKNATEAAKLLGISRATIYRKLKKMGYE
jgi:two-component system response regulator AtoC